MSKGKSYAAVGSGVANFFLDRGVVSDEGPASAASKGPAWHAKAAKVSSAGLREQRKQPYTCSRGHQVLVRDVNANSRSFEGHFVEWGAGWHDMEPADDISA